MMNKCECQIGVLNSHPLTSGTRIHCYFVHIASLIDICFDEHWI